MITPEEFVADPEAALGRLHVLVRGLRRPAEVGGITLDLTPGSYLLIRPVSADEASPRTSPSG